MVHPGVADDVVAGDDPRQVVLEELLHVAGVSAGAAEEGRRLKGAGAGAHGKVLGVQHDAGQHRLGLDLEEVGGLQDVLEQLGDQLAGRGCVGLVEVEGGVGDIGGRPAVVVDDGHPGAALQQVLAHDLLGAVGVHHHQQCPGVGQDDGVLGGEEGLLVLRHLGELLRHVGGGVGAPLLDDADGDPLLPGNGAHAGTGADAVQVGELVAHDKDVGGVGDELGQGVGHDPALDLGALFHLLVPAAVELEVELVLHHRLVAAPGQRHLDGEGGVLEELVEAGGVLAHADGQCGGHRAGGGDVVDGVQHVELGLLEVLEIALLEEKEVAVPVVAEEESAGGVDPGREPLVDLAAQGGTGGLVGVLHGILVVVQQQDGHHGLGGEELLLHLGVLGDLHPVGGGQHGRPAALLLGADQGAVDQKPPVVQHHLAGTDALALQEPPGIEAGDQGGEAGVEKVLLAVGELEEPLVGPDDLVGVRVEDDHGQGGVDHGVPGGHVHVGGDRLDIAEHFPLADAVAAPEVEVEDNHHHPLDDRQGDGE